MKYCVLTVVDTETVVKTQIDSTGGPLDMRILGLVKTRISGKSHSENHKVVIHMCMIFKCV